MKIVVWISEDAPPSQRAIARFLDGKRFLPTFASGPTEEAVIAKAQAFLDSERAKYADRKGRKPATVADAIIERVGKPDPVVDAPATRYFYHPESDSLMTTEDGSDPRTGGSADDTLTEELTRGEYIAIQRRADHGSLAPATDDLDDLLA